jgi:predicted amidohydrolase YtcJ
MDRLLVNARVLTMDPARPEVEAVAVAGGRISAVGASAELLTRRDRDTEVIDLGGRTVVPGFVDAHNHFGPTTLNPRGVDLADPPVATIADIQARIATAARDLAPGAWIRAFAHDELALRGRRHPSRWELDEAAPEHPVVLVHRSYHRAVANSRALALAGVVYGHTYLPGGAIDCDPAGEPIGVLAETATNAVQRLSMAALMERHAEELLDLVEANARYHLAHGITAIQDAWVPPMFYDLIHRAAAAGRLPLYYSPLRGSANGLFDTPAPWLERRLDGDLPPRLRRGGIKLFADGAGVTAATRWPGHGGHERGVDEGILFYPQDTLNSLVGQAHDMGLTVAIHAIGNRAIEAALAAIERTRAAVPGGHARLRIDHFFWGTNADVARLKALEAGVVTQPVGVWQFGDRTLAQHRPPQFLDYPIGQLRAAGVSVGGSSDAPCFALSPLWGIAAAVERRTAGGAAYAPEQAVGVVEAIHMYTLGSAWAIGTDDVEGSITPGKLANLVVLSDDPRAVPPARIRELTVAETWVDGERVDTRTLAAT